MTYSIFELAALYDCDSPSSQMVGEEEQMKIGSTEGIAMIV